MVQLWNGGYILDWAGLLLEFAGAALAAFSIMPTARNRSADQQGLRTSDAFLILQSRQIRFAFIVLALGCLLQCAGTFQAALPLFAK